jgi:hypothetical protein
MLTTQILHAKWFKNDDEFYRVVDSVLFRFYDRQLFEHGIAQALNQLVFHKHCHTFQMGDSKELGTFVDQYRCREYKQTVLYDNLSKIVEIIA